jgi:hypothetical protein
MTSSANRGYAGSVLVAKWQMKENILHCFNAYGRKPFCTSWANTPESCDRLFI